MLSLTKVKSFFTKLLSNLEVAEEEDKVPLEITFPVTVTGIQNKQNVKIPELSSVMINKLKGS